MNKIPTIYLIIYSILIKRFDINKDINLRDLKNFLCIAFKIKSRQMNKIILEMRGYDIIERINQQKVCIKKVDSFDTLLGKLQ